MLLLVVNMQSKVLYSKYKIVFYNNYFLLTTYNVGWLRAPQNLSWVFPKL